MSELHTIEHSIEEKLHAILHQLEAKLQQVFGSHPDIAVHVATAKAQVSEVVAPPIVAAPLSAQEEPAPAPPAPEE